MPALSVSLGEMVEEAERERYCLEWVDATAGSLRWRVESPRTLWEAQRGDGVRDS